MGSHIRLWVLLGASRSARLAFLVLVGPQAPPQVSIPDSVGRYVIYYTLAGTAGSEIWLAE